MTDRIIISARDQDVTAFAVEKPGRTVTVHVLRRGEPALTVCDVELREARHEKAPATGTGASE